MRSIRSYLLTRLLGGVAVVLTGAGAVEYVVLTRSAEAHFDRNLADRVQGFASILFQVENTVEFEFSDELMPEYDVFLFVGLSVNDRVESFAFDLGGEIPNVFPVPLDMRHPVPPLGLG